MMTITAAKTTADPELAIVRAMESFGSAPSSSRRRWRLMMNRA